MSLEQNMNYNNNNNYYTIATTIIIFEQTWLNSTQKTTTHYKREQITTEQNSAEDVTENEPHQNTYKNNIQKMQLKQTGKPSRKQKHPLFTSN